MDIRAYGWRRLTTIFSLIATFCASAASAGAQNCRAPGFEAKTACSLVAKRCCCAPADAPRICKCREAGPPAPESVPPDRDSGQKLIWAASVVEGTAFKAHEPAEPAQLLPHRALSRPEGPSIQTLLCLWLL